MFPAPSYHILQRGERRESRNALAALWLLFLGNLFLSFPFCDYNILQISEKVNPMI